MLKRNIRLKREYLYRKSLEGKERTLYEKKRKLKECLEEGKEIPTELRNEAEGLRKEIDLEDKQTAELKPDIDDEYANVDQKDPKILITTSHDPSAPLTQFVKELKLIFPNAERKNRGHLVLTDLVETCRNQGYSDLVLVYEQRGKPKSVVISHLPYGPTATFGLHNVVTRHDIKDRKSVGTMSEAYPWLIFHNLTTKVGKRTANILKHLFPDPKLDSKRLISFTNKNDCISFRHQVYEKRGGGPNSTELMEVGPRFEMTLYKIILGTIDQEKDAKIEYIRPQYINTAKKHAYLGD